jgi:hypothetical protein
MIVIYVRQVIVNLKDGERDIAVPRHLDTFLPWCTHVNVFRCVAVSRLAELVIVMTMLVLTSSLSRYPRLSVFLSSRRFRYSINSSQLLGNGGGHPNIQFTILPLQKSLARPQPIATLVRRPCQGFSGVRLCGSLPVITGTSLNLGMNIKMN